MLKSKEFLVIESLFLKYRKFSCEDLTLILNCGMSKVRKLTSLYAKEYKIIRGTAPYSIVLEGAATMPNCRRFLIAEDFAPISIKHTDSKLDFAHEIIMKTCLLNAVTINEVSIDGTSPVIGSINPDKGKQQNGYSSIFLLIDCLLNFCGEFDLIDLQKYLDLDNAKKARYFASLYSKKADVTYCKSTSVYKKGKSWKPVSLTNEDNYLSILSSYC